MLNLNNIKSEIENFIKKEYLNTQYEIEVKYGIYKKYFLSSINYVYFDRLRKKFNFSDPVESNVYSWNEYRKIETNGIEICQIKKNIKHYEFRDYNIRLSINKETTIPSYKIPDEFEINLTRKRKRWNYKFDDKFELSLTQVQLERMNYEVELELLNFKYFSEYDELIKEIFCILYDTNLIYTFPEKNKLNDEIGNLLNHSDHKKAKLQMENDEFRFGPFIYKSVLVEPRNIKKDDISYNGFFSKYGPYSITHKADGIRRMLIINSTGLWLILPPFEYNLVIRMSNNKIFQKLFQDKTFVIDGELTNNEFSKYYFLVFDCLAINQPKAKATDIQYKNYNERLNCIQKYLINNLYQLNNKNKSENIEREIKKIQNIIQIKVKNSLILNKSNFYTQIENFIKTKPDYKTDGYIFTPFNSQYNPFSQLNRNNRNLINYPDVCKWKPPYEITIDFIVERNNKNEIVLYYAKEFYDEGPDLIEFKGSTFFPDVFVDHNNEITKNVRNGSVVEYYWDYNLKLFIPKCIRDDKQSANRRKVVMNNWSDIMDPIRIKDITGNSLKNVFWYHNRIKKELYQFLEKGSNILDIGTGVGGDINKWKNNFILEDIKDKNLILAIEPLISHIEIMKRRINNLNVKNNIKILETIGQDSYSIIEECKLFFPEGKADAITLMLSLSFFWKSEDDLDSLVNTIINTIKPGGKILFMTIDGNTLNKLFKNDKLIISDLASFEIKNKTNSNFNNKISITIDESITASEQDEYLVFIDDLTLKLEKYNFQLKFIKHANEEKLLTDDQKLYSSLYTYGYYQQII